MRLEFVLRRRIAVMGLALLGGCSAGTRPTGSSPDFVGPPGSAAPNLVSDDGGRLILTWLETDSGGQSALRLAVRSETRWSPPRTIYASNDLFVNWADFPSLTVTRNGVWVAHVLEKSATSPYAYHALVTVSRDSGVSWSPPIPVHEDRSDTEHGFVSTALDDDGGIDLAWLDGRAMGAEVPGPMAIRSRRMDGGGLWGPERLLDDRTCECCQTAATRTPDGLVVAYRDRSLEEIRDIAVVREQDGRFTDPVIVAADGWEHRACPVNGPALVSAGTTVTLAWYTGAGPEPRVYAIRSTDAGRTWGDRIQINEGPTLGRVDLVTLGEDGAAAIVWLETGEGHPGGAVWRARRLAADGGLGEIVDVAPVSRARVSGFPRLAIAAGELFMAMTDTDSLDHRTVQVRRVISLP